MRAPASSSGLGADVCGAIALGALGAAMAVLLPAFLSVLVVVALLGASVLLRFGSGSGSGTGSGGGPADLTNALLVATAFTMPMNGLIVPGTANAFSDGLLVLTFGALVLVRLTEPRGPSRSGYRPLLLGVGILAAGGFVGALFEVAGPFMYKALGLPIRDVSGWSENMSNLLNLLGGAVLPIAVWALARPGRAVLRRVMWSFVAGATVSALMGVVRSGGGGRMNGLTVHPNQLGSLSVMAIGVALALLLSSRRRLLLPYLCLPILAYAILGSGSRAALGGVAILAVVIGPLTRSRAVMGGLLTGLAVVLVAFATGVVRPEGENALGRALGDSETAEGSDIIRERLQTKVWDRFEQRPLTGNGYNYMRPSHNVYLGLIASAGVLGVIGLGVVVTTVMRRAWRRRADLLAVAVAATYLAYLANAYFDNIFWMRWLWFFVGMVAAAGITTPGPGEAGHGQVREDEEPAVPRELAGAR